MAVPVSGAILPFLYGTAWKKDMTADYVTQAVLAGFQGIDTACQPRHYREDLVGVAVARLASVHGISRDLLWLQTKYSPYQGFDGTDPAQVPYDPHAPLAYQVEQSITRSMQNLRTTYIDSIVLHSPLHTFEATLEVWHALERAVDGGKVKQLGISNLYDLPTLQSLHNRGRIKPVVLQNRFYAETGFDAGLRSFCRAHGIMYQSFWTLTANPHILGSSQVASAAIRLRATPVQVLFRWLIQSGYQPLTGTRSQLHMHQDLDATRLTLRPMEMREIGKLLQ